MEMCALASLVTLMLFSKFFATANIIDTHNQLQQDLLQLKKKWLTKKNILLPDYHPIRS
jgi:hypothetical protein